MGRFSILSFSIFVALCAQARAAEDTKLLFDPASATAQAQVHADNSALKIDPDPSHKALHVVAAADQGFPGITISPPEGDWNLSEYRAVSAEITNLSTDKQTFSLRLDEDTDWSKNPYPCNAGHIEIEPGASVTIQTLFGENYGAVGYAIDPSKIQHLLIFLDQQQNTPREFLVDHIQAIKTADAEKAALLQPNLTGLIAWFDASRKGMVEVDDSQHVTAWHDRTDSHHDLTPLPGTAGPQRMDSDINGRAVLRFDGDESVALNAPLRVAPEAVTVIAVWKPIDWNSKSPPVCLATSVANESVSANHSPNFQLFGKATSAQQLISFEEQSNLPIGRIIVGGPDAPLHADLAELLVYDRAFLSEGERQITMNYLAHKWGAEIPGSGWTRKGDLGPTPRRITDALPLSDQQNQGKWRLDPAFSDEFKSSQVDETKWRIFSPETRQPGDWLGRNPALFMRHNVAINDGELQLTFRKEDVPAMKDYHGYAGYTSAYITTRQRTGYGYYEICAKPMNSAGSSSFWFTDTPDPDHATEIDVFEIGAKGRGFEHNYNMTIHVWSMPNDKRHWGVGGVYHTPWNLGDDYHVYGFDWNKDQLVWYVDGVPVHAAKNTNWLYPMKMIFDSEAMWSWFGKVNDADLPSTFKVKYVRTWRSDAPVKQFVPENVAP